MGGKSQKNTGKRQKKNKSSFSKTYKLVKKKVKENTPLFKKKKKKRTKWKQGEELFFIFNAWVSSRIQFGDPSTDMPFLMLINEEGARAQSCAGRQHQQTSGEVCHCLTFNSGVTPVGPGIWLQSVPQVLQLRGLLGSLYSLLFFFFFFF